MRTRARTVGRAALLGCGALTWFYVLVFVEFVLLMSGAHTPEGESTAGITVAILVVLALWLLVTGWFVRRQVRRLRRMDRPWEAH